MGEDQIEEQMNYLFSSEELNQWAGTSMFEAQDWHLRSWIHQDTLVISPNKQSLNNSNSEHILQAQEIAMEHLQQLLESSKLIHPVHESQSIFYILKHKMAIYELALNIKRQI